MTLPQIVVTVALVAAGLFLYDQVVAEDRTAPAAGYGASLEADPLPRTGRPDARPETASGPSDEALRERVAHLERVVSDWQARRETGGSVQVPAGGGALEDDLPAGAAGGFDEAALDRLEAAIEEINRRKAAERQRERIQAEFDRLDVQVDAAARRKVVATTLRYQTRARDLLRRQWSRDPAGADARREAFEALKQEYEQALLDTVPEVEARKIMQSRIVRGMGFFAGGGPVRNRAFERR